MSPRRLRCAIYTRKSSEEGLDQAFNSLDAQREACEAYIKSQRHEGWALVRTRYDDGGLSGATMDRPALTSLLDDVRARRVDVIVVYKVDRLTRALSDFAKMVEVFDTHQVSFVSVTQQFNTTTSMGRLTLNVLLSFAQFEREVTAERIRDKVAASKRKGMWMGGVVPLGYDAVDKSLVVNEHEAETVRQLFELYLKLGSVRAVKREADAIGLRTKLRSTRNGESRGGRLFARGHLYKLLSNPLYAGEVVHKGQRHEGVHDAIIDKETWDMVQAQMKGNAVSRRSRTTAATPSVLAGRLFDCHGRRLVPSHTNKSGKRYRYYVSRGDDRESSGGLPVWRLSADDLERLVLGQVCALLRDAVGLCRHLEAAGANGAALSRIATGDTEAAADQLTVAATGSRRAALVATLDRVEVSGDRVRVTVSGAKLLAWLQQITGDQRAYDLRDEEVGPFTVDVAARIRRCGNGVKLLVSDRARATPVIDPRLVTLVAQARDWFDDLRRHKVSSLRDLARSLGRDRSDVGRILRLAFLAPDIVDAIATGHQPRDLKVTRLSRLEDLPFSWAEQRRLLGFKP